MNSLKILVHTFYSFPEKNIIINAYKKSQMDFTITYLSQQT